MAVEITLVRHGETEANAAGVWQGTSDSPLSDAGRRQVAQLAGRFGVAPPHLVVASDLPRALDTAGAIGGAEVDARWRELHLGTWEGLTRAEIAARDPDAYAVLGSGRDVAFGGGERLSDMNQRLTEAFFDLVSRLDDGERAVVVSHGGAVLSLISAFLGVDTVGKLLRLTNTSLSTIRVSAGKAPSLTVFNDSTHLPGDPVRAEPGSTHLVLARHGETVANLEGRWQGQSHGELTPEGRAQAERLGRRFPTVDVLFTSPLARARETALLVADGSGHEPQDLSALREFGFGRWEMMTVEEIRALEPEAMDAVEAGNDLVRGGNGETFAALGERVRAALDRLAEEHRGATIGAVSHGAATRAYAAGILGLDFADRQRIGLLANTGMARVVYGSRGPAVAAWNLTPHLER